jgi:hypothetical protein
VPRHATPPTVLEPPKVGGHGVRDTGLGDAPQQAARAAEFELHRVGGPGSRFLITLPPGSMSLLLEQKNDIGAKKAKDCRAATSRLPELAGDIEVTARTMLPSAPASSARLIACYLNSWNSIETARRVVWTGDGP